MDVAGTRHWFSRLGVEDKTHRSYPGAGHTLDLEPDRNRYLAHLVGWLSARVPSGSSRPTGVVPDADGDRAAAVRGRPSLQGRLQARRRRSDHLRESVPPGGPGHGVCGLGESLPRAYVSGERREGAFALLRDSILPALLGHTFQSLPDLMSFFEKCDGRAPTEWVVPEVAQTSAWCSVDMALLDAFGREFGEPVSLGGQPPTANALLGERYSGGCPPVEGGPCDVAAQDAGLPVPARQAEGRT